MADLVEDGATKIAVIDFAGLQGTFPDVEPVALAEAAKKFGTALHDVGFAYILNHGVDMKLVRKLFNFNFNRFYLRVIHIN
jgi:isopenicillin N synthase-like dioxygenase